MILIGARSRPSLGQRLMAGLWVASALASTVLIVALGLAMALLLIPVVMITILVIWVKLRLRSAGGDRASGRRNVRVIRR